MSHIASKWWNKAVSLDSLDLLNSMKKRTTVFETPHCTVLIHSSYSSYREATYIFEPVLYLVVY